MAEKPPKRRKAPKLTQGTALPPDPPPAPLPVAEEAQKRPKRDFPVGQVPKLTDAVQAAILEKIAAGLYFKDACLLAGVSASAGQDWLARGQGTDKLPLTPRYVSFFHGVEKARARAVASRIARIGQAGIGGQVIGRRTTQKHGKDGAVIQTYIEETFQPPQWTADAWYLERTRPEEFGRRLALANDPKNPLIDWKKALEEAWAAGRPRKDVTPAQTALPVGAKP